MLRGCRGLRLGQDFGGRPWSLAGAAARARKKDECQSGEGGSHGHMIAPGGGPGFLYAPADFARTRLLRAAIASIMPWRAAPNFLTSADPAFR